MKPIVPDYKVIVAGSRSIWNLEFIYEKLDLCFSNKHPKVEIVCGECEGPDLAGKLYAGRKGYRVKSMPANWDAHPRAAGYIRNTEMAKYADALVAFWDGKSKGTAHMIGEAKKYKIPYRQIIVGPNPKFEDETIMPIKGDHFGKEIGDVPAKYLLWLYNQKWMRNNALRLGVLEYIEDNFQALEKEAYS